MAEPNSKHRASDRVMLGIAISVYAFMIFGGVVLVAFGVARGVHAARIVIGPFTTTEASVISRGHEGDRIRIYYAFTPPNADVTFVGTEDVSPDDFAAAPDGSPIEIAYLPDDPNTNWVVGRSPVLDEVIAAAFGLGLGVFVLAVTQWRFAPPGLRFRRARRGA